MVAAGVTAQREHIREGSGDAAVEDAFLKEPHLLEGLRELDRLRVDRTDAAQFEYTNLDALFGELLLCPDGVGEQSAVGDEQSAAGLVAVEIEVLALLGEILRTVELAAARIAYRGKSFVDIERRFERTLQALEIGGRINGGFGDGVEHGDVEHALMRLAVASDDTGAVDAQHQMVLSQRRVVDQLIIGALQEGGIDREHRAVAA